MAIYCEFEFQGAVIADNVIDGAGSGISVTNFKEGGRLASVRGNVVRNCRARIAGTAPETEGFGIGVEADTAVAGNVIENAQTAGISAGWGEFCAMSRSPAMWCAPAASASPYRWLPAPARR